VSPTEIRGAFTRWTGKHLPELVLAKLRLPARPGACRSRRRIVLHIRRGLRRVTVTVNGRRVRVRGRPNHRYAVIDLRATGRRTVGVTVSGIDGKGHPARSSRRFEACAAGRAALALRPRGREDQVRRPARREGSDA
jgi:hypothetical protein